MKDLLLRYLISLAGAVLGLILATLLFFSLGELFGERFAGIVGERIIPGLPVEFLSGLFILCVVHTIDHRATSPRSVVGKDIISYQRRLGVSQSFFYGMLAPLYIPGMILHYLINTKNRDTHF